jgi:muramoyltetrapeptide carboxypeptidase
MKTIKAKKLQKGDTIGILAVSGKIKEFERIENAKKFLEQQGYNVVISSTCETSHKYMAGLNEDECIKNLHDFFLNDEIDAILCARGGFGTLKLIDKIDWELIKNHPKIFAGYSDITVLLNLIYKKTSLITFHSAMANGDFGGEIKSYTMNSFFNTLNAKTNCIMAENSTIFKTGIKEGKLWGGNLSTLVSLCGLDFVPNEDLILFLEDLNEPIYKIDKMLTQLFNVEKIKNNVKAIAFGEFMNCSDEIQLKELFNEFSTKLNLPSCCGFKITHSDIKDTIPVGLKVQFNAEKSIITFKEEYLI